MTVLSKILSALMLSAALVQSAHAVLFGGIDFPQGASSFADNVLRYDPTFGGGNVPTNADFTDPAEALGPPDFASGIGSVSLGSGGLLELGFTDNVLTNSGDGSLDLHVFEIGPDVEDTFVAIRPTLATELLLGAAFDANSDGFYEIGKVFGSTASIDIDVFFIGFAAGALSFDAVQLVDDPNEGLSSGATVGADIDAVGAISSTARPVPEPDVVLLLGLGLVASGFLRRRV